MHLSFSVRSHCVQKLVLNKSGKLVFRSLMSFFFSFLDVAAQVLENVNKQKY